MKKIALALTLLFSSVSFAADGQWGVNFGYGIPFVSQTGIVYSNISNSFSAELSSQSLSIGVNDVSVGIAKPELSLRWHPFQGAFYAGLGIGQQTLSSKSTQVISAQSIEVKIDITSTALTPQLGWMWGAGDGGFYGGMEFGYQSPSGASTKITTNADAIIQATPDYQTLLNSVQNEAGKLGEIGFSTFTFLRIGYLF